MQKGSKLINSLAGQPCLLVFIIPNMKHQVHLTTQTMQQHPVIFLICINNDNEKIINMYIDEAMYMYNFVALHYCHGSVQRQGALIIISEWGTNPGGDLTKSHLKAQPPLEVSTPFHCSHRMILQSLFTNKNPLKLPQKVSNQISTTISSGRLVKTPPFLDSTMQVQLVINTPKT